MFLLYCSENVRPAIVSTLIFNIRKVKKVVVRLQTVELPDS